MKIVFTPDWFLGGDVLVEGFSFLILLTFFILSIRNYRLSKNRKELYLGLGFFLIAIAEIATILTKVVLYYDFNVTRQIGQIVVTQQIVKSIDLFYYIGFFIHKLLTLLGLYVIYKIPYKKGNSSDFFLAFYFLMISALFSSTFYYLFHITALILLSLIISNYCVIYKKNKSDNTRILILAFGMLALSQMIFILSKVGILYVAGQLIQLVSYIILLVLIIRIQEYGKKKKQNRYNSRYLGDNPGKGRGN